MGSVVIYPPSPPIFLHSREWAVKGATHRRSRRLALDGLPRLCYFQRRGGGIYPPEPPPFAWRGDPAVDMEQAAHYCRVVYDAGYSPICPMLYLPLFLNDAVPEEHKNGIDMGRDLLRRSRVLVVCGHTITESMKNDIAVAQRLGITATTLEGILTVKGQGRR